jgi:hypothetical protein
MKISKIEIDDSAAAPSVAVVLTIFLILLKDKFRDEEECTQAAS